MKLTAKQLSERLGIDYGLASNLARLAVLSGQVREGEKIPTATGKGKAATAYEFPDTLSFDLTKPFPKVQ